MDARAKRAAKPKASPVPTPAAAADTSAIATALASLAETQRQQGELITRLLSVTVPAAVAVPGLTAPVEQTPEVEWAPPAYANESILVISDLHAPYEHPDALAFLVALRDAYGFERAICTGDETDGHAISFHTSSPNLPSAGQETDMARTFMRRLEAEFPVLDIMHSNHGSLIYRRQQDGGLPDHAMQSYRGFLFGERRKDGSTHFPGDAGRRWRWHDDLEVTLSSGDRALFAHGLSSNVKLAVQKTGTSVVQGHFHSMFDVVAMQGPKGSARFGITGGCLIDPTSYAYAYGKNIPLRPVIGCSGILDGQPVAFRMPLRADGRWTGRLPYGILPGRAA
ncbi:MAG: hypothetical protein ACRYG8_22630 [Janthinobacterium lividum]